MSEVAVGDRVAMPWLGYACGNCDYCVSGWETLCLEQEMMGYTIDGGFGEYATAYARYVVKVPEGVDSFDAAPLTCAGVTTYKAVKVAGTRSSDFVAVFGVGGLGHLAIQYAAIAGGRVVAVDVIEEKLELARELGAEFTINAKKEDPVEAIQRLGGVNQAIALAVSPARSSRRTGRCAAAGRSCSSRCRPTTRSTSRSSRPSSTGSRSSARSSAPERSARGVRAARRRQDTRDPRNATARPGQRGDRRRRGRPSRRANRARAVGHRQRLVPRDPHAK